MVVGEFQAKLLAYRLGVKTSETKMTNPLGVPACLAKNRLRNRPILHIGQA
jgi:hypothetical protein